MAQKKKRLVEHFDLIIEGGDFEAFKRVFDKCEIDAKAPGGKTTCNAFYFKNLTPKHIQFLIDNGLEVNVDCGFGYTAVAYHAAIKENLKCLIDNGADVDFVVSSFNGTALKRACTTKDVEAVRNLLEAGASVSVKDALGMSLLDATLKSCDNIYIPQVVNISKMLLEAGCVKSEKTDSFVKTIGERFEFYRDNISKDIVDRLSSALDELYVLFNVVPVPRRVVYDGTSPITVKTSIWQDQFEELWDKLVPGSGKAQTVQGEMIRIVGRLTNEILDNGSINWGADHKLMLDSYSKFLDMNKGLEQSLVDEAGRISKSISSKSDKTTLYRLAEITVKWVIANPNPIPLGKVDYYH